MHRQPSGDAYADVREFSGDATVISAGGCPTFASPCANLFA